MGYWLWVIPVVVIVAMVTLGYMLVCFANASDDDVKTEGWFSASAASKAEIFDWTIVFSSAALVGICGFLAICFPMIQWANWICVFVVLVAEAELLFWLASWINRVRELIWAAVQCLLPYPVILLIANNLAISTAIVQIIFIVLIAIMAIIWAQGYLHTRKEVS